MADFDLFDGFDELEAEEEGRPLAAEKPKDVFDGFDELAPVADVAKTNLTLAVDNRDPVKEAKSLDYSKKTGIPLNAAREEENVNKFDIFKDFDDATPAVKRYLGNAMVNAGISQNDTKKLSTIDRLLSEDIDITGTIKAGALGAASGILDIPKTFGEAHELISEALFDPPGSSFKEAREISAFVKRAEKDVPTLGGLSRSAQDFLRERVGDTKLEQLVFETGRMTGTAAAVFVSAGASAILPGISAISGVGKAAEARRAGEPFEKVATAGLTAFAIEYLTNIVPVAILRAPALKFFTRLGAGEIADVFGEATATALEMRVIDEGILGREPATMEEYRQAIIDTMLIAAASTFVTTVPAHTLHAATNVIDRAVEKSAREILAREKIAAEVDKTETKQLSNDQMETAIKELDNDTHIYITNDGVEKFFQSDPVEADSIMRKIGLNPDDARKQAAIGQDVLISQAKLFGQLSTEEREILLPHIKTKIESYSSQQITENIPQEEAEQLQETYKDLVAEDTAFNAELDRIKTEQIDAGVEVDKAEANTAIVERFANGLGLQGQDRTAFLNKIKVQKATFAERIIDAGKKIFQADKVEGPKAAVDFILDQEGNEQAIISLFERSDASSVQHELGHIFFKEMQQVELTEGVTDQFKTDMTALRGWLGAEGAAELTVEQQEQFARGWEAFLREGKAPNKGLQAVFRRFKTWLTEVYKRARSLDVELTREVRGVFNRMLDAESETNTVAAINNMIEPTTERMNELGIPNDEQARLKLLNRKAIEDADTKLFIDRNRAVRDNRKQFNEDAETGARAADVRGVYDVIDDIKAQLSEFRILPKIFKAKSKPAVIKLSEKDVNTLNAIKDDIEFGEAARRVAKVDTAGDFRDRGFTKKETLNSINKALDGKKLTVRQQITLEMLSEGYRDQIAEQVSQEFAGVTDDPRFNRQEFVEKYGKDAIKRLPSKIILVNDGKILNEAALQYGFESADDMMNAFFDTPPLQDNINARVDAKNKALEATFRAEDYLAASPEYATYINRMGAHLAAAESRAVRAEVTGKPRKAITAEQMKAFAQAEMLDLSVAEAQRTDKFLSAMKRAGIEMAKAERAKDYAKAIRENEKMALNKEMAAIANRNKIAVDKFVKRAKPFRKLGSPPSVSLRFREGVRSLIHRFSVVPNVTAQRPVTSEDFDKLFKGDDFIGEFITLPFLTNDKNLAQPRDYRKITMLEWQHLDNAMGYLTAQGKHEKANQLSTGEDVVTVSNEAIGEMDAQKKTKKILDRYNPLKKLSEQTDKFFARMQNLSYISKALGGYKSLREGVKSVIETQVVERAKDLRDTQLRRLRKEREAVKPHRDVLVNAQRRIIKEHGRKLFVVDNGVPVPNLLQNNGEQLNYWTPEQVISMAFNRGNDSNTAALVNGFPGLTLGQVDTLINKYMTQQDMDAVQAILDVLEGMAAETDAVHVRLRGYHMDRVKARSWEFKGKTYRGGYFPLAIDRRLASVANDFFNSKKEEGDFFESEDARFAVPYAVSTHTLTRTDGHTYPVALNLSIIDRGIDKSVRYITMSEGIRDIDRIVTYSEKVKDDFGNVIGTRGFKQSAVRIMGEQVYEQIRPALKHFANPVLRGVDVPGSGFASFLRSIAVPAHIALRTITGIKQLGSISSAIGEMGLGEGGGLKAYVKGAMYVAGNAQAAYNTMLDKSAFMKERLQSWERDFLKSRFDTMTPAQKEVSFGNRNITWKQVQDFGYITVRIPDTIAVTPIWWGSYLDKLNDEGTNEKEAVRHADNIVEDTQPTAQPLDLSAWFREGGFWSLFNLHQTFTVGNYGQRQRTWFRAWIRGDISLMQFARFNFMDAIIPHSIMVILVSFLRGGDIKDEEEQKEILEDILVNWALMGLPMATSLYNSLTEGWSSPLEVAGARETEKWISTMRLLSRGFDDMSKKEQERALWGLGDMFSDILRVPISRVAKDIIQGETLQEQIFKPKKKPEGKK